MCLITKTIHLPPEKINNNCSDDKLLYLYSLPPVVVSQFVHNWYNKLNWLWLTALKQIKTTWVKKLEHKMHKEPYCLIFCCFWCDSILKFSFTENAYFRAIWKTKDEISYVQRTLSINIIYKLYEKVVGMQVHLKEIVIIHVFLDKYTWCILTCGTGFHLIMFKKMIHF